MFPQYVVDGSYMENVDIIAAGLVSGTSLAAVVMQGSGDGVAMTNVRFSFNNWDGLEFDFPGNAYYSQLTFSSNGRYGAYSSSVNSPSITFDSCIFVNQSSDAIYISAASNLMVFNSVLTNNSIQSQGNAVDVGTSYSALLPGNFVFANNNFSGYERILFFFEIYLI